MHKTLESVCSALDDLSKAVENTWGDERTLNIAFGGNHPALTRHDLASLSKYIALRIRESDPIDIDDSLIDILKNIPDRLNQLRVRTVSGFFNGHGFNHIPAYLATLLWLEKVLEPLIKWQTVDNDLLPAKMAMRIRSTQVDLDNIIGEMKDLDKQVKLINDATEAVKALPIDLKDLKQARYDVEQFKLAAKQDSEEIEGNKLESFGITKILRELKEESEKIIKQCGEAYQITTTQGLAASFYERSRELETSVWYWVWGLLIALGIGGFMGLERIKILTDLVAVSGQKTELIWMQTILSIISIGAPLWFAWLATKQIGQRFRLAEDYAFKASVARAYEGYKKEATRIDEKFEAQLFQSALTRFDEPPLRHIERESQGSPWEELFKRKVKVQEEQSPSKPEEKT